MEGSLQYFEDHAVVPAEYAKHKVPVRVRLGPKFDDTFDKWRVLASLSNEVTVMMKELCETGHRNDLLDVASGDGNEKLATICDVLFKDNFFDGWPRLVQFKQDYYITNMTQFHAKLTELCAKLRLAGRVLQSSFNDKSFIDRTL